MENVSYLIIGSGMTAFSAAKGIRQLDSEKSIAILSSDSYPPYARPNLSKGLWKNKRVEDIYYNLEDLQVELHLDQTITTLNPQTKTVTTKEGESYTYTSLLLATGGVPIHLSFGGDDIIYYRNLSDYYRLKALSESGNSFLVIGGGFIGSEIAAALTMAKKKVVMVFPEKGIGSHLFPFELSEYLNNYYRKKGVEVISEDSIVSMEKLHNGYSLRTKEGLVIRVDGVVAGIGIHPDTSLAKQANLEINNGIVVNEYLQSSDADIYAAGDVANFFHVGLQKRMRVEHEDNALAMGLLAGRNMGGVKERYTHIPMFYSDLFEYGYEAVGELNSSLETIIEWREEFTKGLIYYLKDQIIVGVLLWNVWDKVDEARAVLGTRLSSKNGPITF